MTGLRWISLSILQDTAFKTKNLKCVTCSGSSTNLHSKDKRLIDTKGLLRGDQQRGDAGERAREEKALIIHLSDNNLVGAIQHPIRECTHTIPIRQRTTQSHQVSVIDYMFLAFCIVQLKWLRKSTYLSVHMLRGLNDCADTHLLVWSLRAEFGAISNSPASTSGLSICSLS